MNPDVAAEINRIVANWTMCRERFGEGGALLFGAFTAADAFYAPEAMRFVTYGVRLPDAASRYVDAVRALPAVQAWSAAARAEREVISLRKNRTRTATCEASSNGWASRYLPARTRASSAMNA